MALGNANVIPRLYAARVIKEYEDKRVYAARTNRTWQSALRQGGNTIRISELVAPTVKDYDASATPAVAYESIDADKAKDLTLSYEKYFAGKIGDIAELQSKPDLMSEYAAAAGVKLAEQVDADVYANMTKSGNFTAGPAIALDRSTALTLNDFKFSLLHRRMDVAKMPREGRWVIVGPYTAEALMATSLSSAFVAADAVSGLQNGRLGTFAGLTLYISGDANSNFDDDSANSNTNPNATETWIFGNNTSLAFVDQVSSIERIRMESDFADGIRGLYTYGMDTIWPDRLYNSICTITKIPL